MHLGVPLHVFYWLGRVGSPGRMEALGTEGVFSPAQERDEMCRGIRPVSVITESPGVTQEGGSYRISLHT